MSTFLAVRRNPPRRYARGSRARPARMARLASPCHSQRGQSRAVAGLPASSTRWSGFGSICASACSPSPVRQLRRDRRRLLRRLEQPHRRATQIALRLSLDHQNQFIGAAVLVWAFNEAAWRYFVYPLDNRDRLEKFADLPPKALAGIDQPRTFLPGAQTTHRIDIFPLISAPRKRSPLT